MSLNKEDIKEKIIEKLQTVFDPELPVNIYDLGLIYNIDINDKGYANITMTLTAPSCPVNVMITWTPKWEKSMMSEVAALELGFM